MRGQTRHIIIGSALVLAFVGATSYAQQQAAENVAPIQSTEPVHQDTAPVTEAVAEPIETPVEAVAAPEPTNEAPAPVSEPVAPVEQPKYEAPVITRGMGQAETTPAVVIEPAEVE